MVPHTHSPGVGKGSSPGERTQSRDDDAGQAERALLPVLVQEDFDAALDLLELLLAHGHGDSLLLEALHLPDEAAVDVGRVALQRHLRGRDELAGAGRGLRSILHLVPAEEITATEYCLSPRQQAASCSARREIPVFEPFLYHLISRQLMATLKMLL